MKINSIKISNILSFEYKESIEEIEDINFDDWLNILIGSNWSWKSNFLEVLNWIFKWLLIKNTVINYQYIEQPVNIRSTIQILNNDTKIEKNWLFEDKEQTIYVNFKINKEDVKNMLILYDNYEKINNIILAYSNQQQINISFDKNLIKTDLEINLLLKSNDWINFSTSVNISSQPELNNFLKNYIEFFNLYKDSIIIFNKISTEKIINIKNTFFLINAYREYDNIKENLNINWKKEILEQSKLQIISKSKVKQLNWWEPDIFDLVRIRLWFDCKDNIKVWWEYEMNLKLNENEIYKDINFILSLINLKFIFNVDADDWNSKVSFIRKGKNINFSWLSSWEKAIVYLAFALYWYYLENWLLIIDEPELHLHPTFQKKYLDILENISIKSNIQIILVTHSPSFINPNVIEKVHKFSIDSWFTKVAFPNDWISIDYKDLLRIIHYTNSEKIFFADKIILVEWDSDEYFFRYFLEKFNKENGLKNDIEIIYIWWKKEFNKWYNFLKLFKINTFFIWDWDNVKDFSIVNDKKKSEYEKIYLDDILYTVKEKVLDSKSSEDWKELLKKLVNYHIDSNKTDENEKWIISLIEYIIKRHIPYWYLINSIPTEDKKEIDNSIEEKYKNWIFILKKWDLEDYLWISNNKKSLKSVIDFCENNFEEWYNKNEEKQNELKEVFWKITK